MGGSSAVDSRGELWIGDGPGAADVLDIRPDDFGGRNTVTNWCAATNSRIPTYNTANDLVACVGCSLS